MSWPASIVSIGPATCGLVVWRSPSQLHVTLIVKATFRLDETMTPLEPEEIYSAERFERGNPTNSVRRADDRAPQRTGAEVVFTGHAHAPGGQPASAHSVRLSVLRDRPLVDKTLHIYGDRSSGSAAPFLKMPIVYERAFGGPGCDDNPIGVGFSASKAPNLTAANIVNPANPALTAGFGPLSRNWRMRRRLLGKVSRKDLDQAIALIPSDFDWSYFHSAPVDQRFDRLHGDEWIVLDGLHAERPRIQVRLPGARAMARIQGLGATEQTVELQADTLQIDGDEEICSLVWRIAIPIQDSAQLERMRFVVGVELPGAPIAWPEAEAPRAPLATQLLEGVADFSTERLERSADSTMAVDPEELEHTSRRPATPFQAASPRSGAPPRIDPPVQAPRVAHGETIAVSDDDDDLERTIARPSSAPTSTRAVAAPPPPPRAPLEAQLEVPGESTMAVDPEELAQKSKRPATPFKAASPWSIAAPTSKPPPPPRPPTPEPRVSHDETIAVSDMRDLERKLPLLPFKATTAPAAPPPTAAVPLDRAPPPLAPLPPLPTPPRPPPGKVPGTAKFFHTSPRPDDTSTRPERDQDPASKLRRTVIPARTHDAIPIVNPTSLVAFTLALQPKPSQEARAVVIKGTFDLVLDGPAKLRDETELPVGDLHAGDEMMRSVLYPSDYAPFKPRADVTLKGHAYAPGGSSPAALARFRFGRGSSGFERQIAVFGERRWQQTVVKTAPTEPQRFERIPIVHELAFGGPGFDKNPMGRGYGAATTLPCLEDPDHLINSPGDTPEPMSFGAVPMLWRERWSRLGSYGGDWLKTRWPYFPDDFDWAFFQAAPREQQLDRVQGDEPFEIVGMHPEHPKLNGSLPRLKPRCFAQKTTEAGGELVEIVMRLDTVTLDVDEMKVNLVWRGLIEVQDDEASELAELFVMVEPLAGAHADLAQARAKYLEIKGPAALAAIPAAATITAFAAGAGGPSNETIAAVPEPRKRLAPHLDPVRGEVIARLARGESLERFDASGADLSDLDFSRRSLAGANFKDTLLRRCSFSGTNLESAQLSNADLTDAALEEANLSLADLTGANLESAKLDRADLTFAELGRVNGTRASFREARGKRTSFAGGVWTKARFDRAAIAGADFTSATLDEAVFDGAVMPEIRLYDARADKASFDDATLTEARADGVQLTRCSLKGVSAASSIWDRAVLDETSFRGAILSASGFNKASGQRTVFSGADLAGARFERAKFPGASLLKANLMEASLHAADLTSADLRGANLHGADTWKTKLKGAQLELAVLTKSKLKGRA